jgi:uncharacterized membrane protein
MEPNILEQETTPDTLRLLAQAGILSPDELEQARRIAGSIPAPAAWSRFLNGLLLFLGSLLLAAGVIFFFAYNWAAMPRLLKFGLIQAALLTAILTVSYQGFEKLGGKAALLVASLLTGALLALYGQSYQTGADSYELFFGWSCLIAGWVCIGNFAPLWLLLLLLLETAVFLYWSQVVETSWFIYRSPLVYEIVFGMNAAALALWEFFSSRGVAWLSGRWIPRTILSSGLLFLVMPITILIVDGHAYAGERLHAALLPLIYFGTTALVLWIYRLKIFDLYMIAATLLSLIVLASVFFGKAIGSDYSGFLLLSMIIVAMSGGAAYWLRTLARPGVREQR